MNTNIILISVGPHVPQDQLLQLSISHFVTEPGGLHSHTFNTNTIKTGDFSNWEHLVSRKQPKLCLGSIETQLLN